MKAWIIEHTPKSRSEVVGRDEELRIVEEYLAGKTKKPILIAGPPGAGKTSLVYAIARELDYEIVEVNASDTRNKQAILDTVGAALKQQSLFMRKRLVLIDEVDGLAGNKDRGGVATIVKLIKETSTPIIMTANDGDSDKLKAVRKVAKVLPLEPLPYTVVLERLKVIAAKEKAEINEETLSTVARRSGGDLRAAINDLQTVASGGDPSLLGERDRTDVIEDALLRIFKTTSPEVALPALDNVPMQPNDVLSWIDHNIAKEYTKPKDLARAYDALSRADVFLGRIRRWQYYRYYVYIYNLLSAGIAIAKDEKYKGIPQFSRPDRGLKIWIARNANLKKTAIAESVADQTHASSRRVIQEFPFYLRMAKDKALLAQFAERFELEPDQVAWMKQKAM